MTPRAMAGYPAARRYADRAEALDRRPRAGGGRRHHDVPRLADHRRGRCWCDRSAVEWQSDVAREVTIQVRPVQGRDLDAEVARAVEIARARPGRRRGAGLFQGGIGAACSSRGSAAGLSLDDLPVPRMIVVKLPSGGVDLAPLRKALAEQVAGASLDDHRAWIDRMRTMAQTTIAGGIGILILMLAATVLSVIFATRGAMATNRPIVEVLHFIGAKSGFIAGQFQRHFLLLGLEGGLIGGGLAMLLFGAAGIAARHERRHGERRSGRDAVRQLLARLGRLSRDRRADRAGRRWSRRWRRGGPSTAPWKRSSSAVPSGRRILRYHPGGDRN